ncbi:MAG TPA: PilT/PilU family type 4a pilus ATPase [Candidatus Methylacidiphilales bacterium]|nr:PilT/PilU family type 4a pilus ATPase [Candidatus Methylacidiphilales bacterium]
MLDFFDNLCLVARQHGASDLFLLEGAVPQIRLGGELRIVGEAVVESADLLRFWVHCGGSDRIHDLDTSYVASDQTRFRVNLFSSMGRRGAVLSHIRTEIPGIETLGVPVPLLTSWMGRRAGLVLVTGPTGSGKSTTLASSIDWLNQRSSRHIVTIEDPIEYLFTPRGCLFTQREVGTDTESFSEGLRRALRQSPDIIFVGEIRDFSTATTALQAAETGHLVLATLHSVDVIETIERMLRLFPTAERDGAIHVLARQLIGVLSQRLLPSLQGGQVLACEHFENEAATRKWILEGRIRELSDFMQRSDNPRNADMLSSIVSLCRRGVIAEETGLQSVGSPQNFSRALRGISSGGLVAR